MSEQAAILENEVLLSLVYNPIREETYAGWVPSYVHLPKRALMSNKMANDLIPFEQC